MTTSGCNVEVKTFGVAEDSTYRTDLPYSVKWKKIYNEMVELWGSILELLIYKIRGHLPEQRLGDVPMIRYVKSLLLFE